MGLFVWVLILLVTWNANRDAIGIRYGQWHTQYVLQDRVNDAIKQYQQDHGHQPELLNDLQAVTDLDFTETGELLDGWDNPMVANFDGENLIVTSYGRDGEPGGTGLDHDLTNLNPTPVDAKTTLYQFLFDAPTKAVQGWCFLLGLAGAYLTFMGLNRDVINKRSRIHTAFSFGSSSLPPRSSVVS